MQLHKASGYVDPKVLRNSRLVPAISGTITQRLDTRSVCLCISMRAFLDRCIIRDLSSPYLSRLSKQAFHSSVYHPTIAPAFFLLSSNTWETLRWTRGYRYSRYNNGSSSMNRSPWRVKNLQVDEMRGLEFLDKAKHVGSRIFRLFLWIVTYGDDINFARCNHRLNIAANPSPFLRRESSFLADEKRYLVLPSPLVIAIFVRTACWRCIVEAKIRCDKLVQSFPRRRRFDRFRRVHRNWVTHDSK